MVIENLQVSFLDYGILFRSQDIVTILIFVGTSTTSIFGALDSFLFGSTMWKYRRSRIIEKSIVQRHVESEKRK